MDALSSKLIIQICVQHPNFIYCILEISRELCSLNFFFHNCVANSCNFCRTRLLFADRKNAHLKNYFEVLKNAACLDNFQTDPAPDPDRNRRVDHYVYDRWTYIFQSHGHFHCYHFAFS